MSTHFNATVLSKIHEERTGVYKSPSSFLVNKSAKRVIAVLAVESGLPYERLVFHDKGCDRSKWGIYLHNSLREDFSCWLEYSGIEPRERDIRLKLLARDSGLEELSRGLLGNGEFIKISSTRKCLQALGEVLVFADSYNAKPRIHLYGLTNKGFLEKFEDKCFQLGVKVTYES